jgi:uracil-DNA glycosylase
MTIKEYFRDWLDVIDSKELTSIINKLNTLYSSKSVMPEYKDVFKAFTLLTRAECKIVFLGMDPYPQRGVATGILFGNKKNTKLLSPSLEIIKEASIDYEIPHYLIDFDVTLESWGKQGILMLNSALTCEENKIGSHTMLWRPFISTLLRNLSSVHSGLIYVLFGSQAQTFEPYINTSINTVFKINHPSYYARTNTKMPSSLFKEINDIIYKDYGTRINWFNYRKL